MECALIPTSDSVIAFENVAPLDEYVTETAVLEGSYLDTQLYVPGSATNELDHNEYQS